MRDAGAAARGGLTTGTRPTPTPGARGGEGELLQGARHLDSAISAPGEAWERRKRSRAETFLGALQGTTLPGKASDQPEPSVAWSVGNCGREAYTGWVQAA